MTLNRGFLMVIQATARDMPHGGIAGVKSHRGVLIKNRSIGTYQRDDLRKG